MLLIFFPKDEAISLGLKSCRGLEVDICVCSVHRKSVKNSFFERKLNHCYMDHIVVFLRWVREGVTLPTCMCGWGGEIERGKD